VLSDLPVFRENLEDGAILAADLSEFASVVGTFCFDADFRAQRAAAARSLARRFSARRSAQVLLGLRGELPGLPAIERAVPA
jgi:hypothetical protein